MPCRVDPEPPWGTSPTVGSPKAQQIEAANHLITLLKHEGDWDKLDKGTQNMMVMNARGHASTHGHVEELCAMIRAAGGTEYVDAVFMANKNADTAGLYAWWLRHEERDQRRAARMADVRAKVERDRKIKRERERDERHRDAVKARFKFLDDKPNA